MADVTSRLSCGIESESVLNSLCQMRHVCEVLHPAQDSNVSGFLPIDWNGDGNMDLIVGAWGESHLKYFQAGYCQDLSLNAFVKETLT